MTVGRAGRRSSPRRSATSTLRRMRAAEQRDGAAGGVGGAHGVVDAVDVAGEAGHDRAGRRGSARARRAARRSCPRSACGRGAARWWSRRTAPARPRGRARRGGARSARRRRSCWRVVELVVAREDDRADRRLDGQRRGVGDGVRDADELDREGAGRHALAGHHGHQRRQRHLGLRELRAHERDREREADDAADRHAAADQVGQRGDVVVVAVRQQDGGDRPVAARARRPAAAAPRARRDRVPRGKPTPQSTTIRSPPQSRRASCCARPRPGRRSASLAGPAAPTESTGAVGHRGSRRRAGEGRGRAVCHTWRGSGVWRSLVARSVRVGEVPSSNLGTPIDVGASSPASPLPARRGGEATSRPPPAPAGGEAAAPLRRAADSRGTLRCPIVPYTWNYVGICLVQALAVLAPQGAPDARLAARATRVRPHPAGRHRRRRAAARQRRGRARTSGHRPRRRRHADPRARRRLRLRIALGLALWRRCSTSSPGRPTRQPLGAGLGGRADHHGERHAGVADRPHRAAPARSSSASWWRPRSTSTRC